LRETLAAGHPGGGGTRSAGLALGPRKALS
jgi:hypothetical protein